MKILELIKKYLIPSRWKICPPKERDVLIFDGIKIHLKNILKNQVIMFFTDVVRKSIFLFY